MTTRVKKEGSIWPWIAAGAVLAAALSVAGYLFFQETGGPEPRVTPVFQTVTTIDGARVGYRLYFPSEDGVGLMPETRNVLEQAEKADQVREVVSELIRGPLSEGLSPSFPPTARVKSVFLDTSGTAYINFSRELQADFPGGAWTETLAIYSLVNTLTADFPEIKQVQILIEGAVQETVAGHIDISRPFAPRTALNKENNG